MKINLTTLGCPKNLVDSEYLLGGLKGDNVEFVQNPDEADTIILNTCGFIQGAKEESIDAILQAVELKKTGRCKQVFVTGCLSQRYPSELQKELPEVDGIFGNRDMQQVIRELTTKLDLRREILGDRLLQTPSHFAYLKVSEGCENPCTFCSIPGIRGRFVSKPIEKLVDEAQALADAGVRELIIVAQDTTVYGCDIYGEARLVPLLSRLCDIDAFKWIRLLYTYPAHFSQELVDFLADARKINYVDIPVQHSSNRLLRRMARKITRQDIERIITGLRAGNSNICLRSTCIVGFPGETEDDQSDLYDFLGQTRFERLGLFAFSREEGTPAYHFDEQVPEHVIHERLAELNDLQNDISLERNRAALGCTIEVLIEAFDAESGCFVGRTANDCPEIDNTVKILADDLSLGQFYDVVVTDFSDYELIGRPCAVYADETF